MKLVKTKKIISFILAVVILGTAVFGTYTDAEAAGKKVTTSADDYKRWKKAPAVKKGTTTVTMKVDNGTVKFVAPKTKTYKITVSNFVCPKDKNCELNGYFKIRKLIDLDDYSFLDTMKVVTEGGKNTTLWVANAAFLKDYDEGSSVPKKMHIMTSRTATVKLKKGQVIYISGSFSKTKNVSYKLKIK